MSLLRHHALLRTPAPSGDITTGLVLHLPMTDASYASPDFIDEVGGIEFTYTGTGPAFVTGPITTTDGAVDFPQATNDKRARKIRIVGADRPIWLFNGETDSYTTTVWYKNSGNVVGNGNRMFSTEVASGTAHYDCVIYPRQNGLILARVNDGSVTSAIDDVDAGDLYDGDWHLITHVVDQADGETRLYVDTTEVGSASIPAFSWPGTSGNTLQAIVGNGSSFDRQVEGTLAEVRRYSRALTTDDIAILKALQVN